ncbi:MAG: excinuclease ABC subunit UvrA, partial [Rhodoferax sp.]|uniref:excinuclease ABC subunit UvrA n=1 Tax=Rhodoferax sp. TaxID=50421 RepID=UPI001B522881
GELTVVTGPSGSGKSSLVFDTLFAEGQRRYVETFSAYARQFLDRMDKPAVDKVEGVPPAIAIDQTNPVRSSRSTVGTMTELNDHLKLFFARTGQLFDRLSARPVRHDTPESIYTELVRRLEGTDARVSITFPVELPVTATPEEVAQWLSVSGFTKVQAQRHVVVNPGTEPNASAPTGKAGVSKTSAVQPRQRKLLDVVADRFRLAGTERARVLEAIEVALKHGSGQINVYVSNMPPAHTGKEVNAIKVDEGTSEIWRFSTGLHCPESNLRYADPLPSMFSFNSAVGACETCRGFGRVIGVDYGLVIPDDKLTLRAGAIKPIQTPAWKEAQDDLMRHAEVAGIPRDTPWNKLTPEQQHWVIQGSPQWNGKWNQHWFGIKRFFDYLETKAYKMHIRVLLSKYRSYTPCPACRGARIKTESLLWRIGSKAQADAVLPPARRFMPSGVTWTRAQLESLPGLCLHDLMLLSLDRLQRFFDGFETGVGQPQELKLLQEEICTRLKYLNEVGIGYLTLDRQSRTLSGGEVQRINLTTALGTSLVNTLFVLDEPSIGLHPRDMHRIIVAMQRLRDAGNTLVVVEHDPAVMMAADRMLDMGPGPGERGGQIVFDGSTADLRRADTLTGAYLGGRKQVGMGFKRLVADNTPRLILEGAREHNLKNIDIDIPLQRLVCVTGVSGSGKSTLIQNTLAPALLRHFGKSTDAPGDYDRLLGAEQLSDVVFVDQSPIGKTARSNPASFVGAWDSIRELFANAALSRQRGYTASKFSFNSGDGRCPTCGGSGFEHVEMQFLSDIYLRCPDCNGQRFRPEVLEITIERGARVLSIADVLDLTVSEAVALFAQDREVTRTLQPIVDVGLDYVKLGQPVPTLSGGEAQRLKLAGFLADASKGSSASRQALARRGILFMLDEPTTGLHFDDIAKLMRALRKLQDAGHSLLVIEHNLDVIRAADWLIDLGPEGGDAGGELVAYGPPEALMLHASSHTALALRDYAAQMGVEHQVADYSVIKPEQTKAVGKALEAENTIKIINAREHNLKSLSVDIPRGQFTVVTGVSGSGKSTLAFDILFNEGQRRYLESLN